jgi:hypothetical protein
MILSFMTGGMIAPGPRGAIREGTCPLPITDPDGLMRRE